MTIIAQDYHLTARAWAACARPGSSLTLAIIERIWSGFFGLIFGFVGFSLMFARGLISAF